MDKVDETIESICDWIQVQIKESDGMYDGSVVPEMTKALAELVSARWLSVISENNLLENAEMLLNKRMTESLQKLNQHLHY
ncbi:hypothetical protein BRYFOR_07573 [Marvinbryantia formatexigens DSM 14469]|uniref:Uncharacterized protein n=1 Tax=Marvinbryantia formatexigens DSM 14469 TaxID=478749 RepID=C6LG13_9FIRM|nr:hypothetical protein [Marvinbryantia formatexigens]EET60377.1 hypothetical protein BRYFOR_07573 [Marvinbryantia formatexigens DSM 14469]UWO25282.1 hypothetical protein NQ534_01960 [Marvinbryantia formatexigens DSM 14469]SDH02992.1 hypothetical protein SAMN05660368_03705 [Marvinbryantia formatexigens]